MTFPAAPFEHLRRLTDAGGLHEHADHTTPRSEHGYCVDDVARGLVVAGRQHAVDGTQADLCEQYLAFVLASQVSDGRFRNRRGPDLRWTSWPSVDDCWGRALWGLGVTVAHTSDPTRQAPVLEAFEVSARWRPSWLHSLSFAALGAGEVLRVRPDHTESRALLEAVAAAVGRPSRTARWPWPMERLSYSNATIAQALLAAGTALDEQSIVDDGLFLLEWLLALQTRRGHLSVVPAGGQGHFDVGPGYDQQPIEVGALADACAHAYAITKEQVWADGILAAARWFLGDNDTGTVVFDADSGGCCDGLEPKGRNENQGAESTLALVSTLQHVHWLARAS